jgi:hypothetical protein
MHSAFAFSEEEGRVEYADIKTELVLIMEDRDPESRHQKMKRLSARY